jgi:biopolymer transport protein ExbD
MNFCRHADERPPRYVGLAVVGALAVVVGAGAALGLLPRTESQLDFVLADAPAWAAATNRMATAAGPTNRAATLAVAVARDGRLTVAEQAAELEELAGRCAAGQDGPVRAVVVRADRDVPFGRVAAVLDACRAAGVTNVAFAVAR